MWVGAIREYKFQPLWRGGEPFVSPWDPHNIFSKNLVFTWIIKLEIVSFLYHKAANLGVKNECIFLVKRCTIENIQTLFYGHSENKIVCLRFLRVLELMFLLFSSNKYNTYVTFSIYQWRYSTLYSVTSADSFGILNFRIMLFIFRFSSGGLCVRGQLNNRWSRLHEASKEPGLCGGLPSLVQNHHNDSSTFLRHDVLQHMHFQLLQEKQVNPRYWWPSHSSGRGYTLLWGSNQSLAGGVMFETYFATTFPPYLYRYCFSQAKGDKPSRPRIPAFAFAFRPPNFYWRPSCIRKGYRQRTYLFGFPTRIRPSC